MKSFVAVVAVALLSLLLAGIMFAVFGRKAGVGSLVILMFLVSYSRRIAKRRKGEVS